MPEIPGNPAAATDETTRAPDPVSPEEISRRVEALAAEREQLALKIQQQPDDAALLSGTEERLGQIGQLLKAQRDLVESLSVPLEAQAEPGDDPSIYRLNALYEQVATIDAAVRDKRAGLEAARESLESLESRVREAKTALADSSPKARLRRERALQSAELAAREVREQVNLATLELRAAKRDAGLAGVLQDRIDELRRRLAAGEGATDGSIATLVEREGVLERAKASAERRLATADMRLAAARQRYAQDPQASAELLAVVEALTTYRDAIGKRISLAASELERLVGLRDIWRDWEALLRSSYTEEELASWEELAAAHLSDMRLTAALRKGQAADLQIRLQNLETRIRQLPPESQTRQVLEETGEVAHRLQTDLGVADRLLASDIRLTERFGQDIAEITGDAGLMEILSEAMKTTVALWNFEITTIDDAPFTVGSLLIGLLLFAAGLWASRLGAAAIGGLAARRLKLDAGATQAMQTFSFYALLAAFTLMALKAVHFPLTAFTFLGGALAIGVGFGSQNVMNNFISGLILMLERPVRAQDVVEIDGAHGVIQKIGPRSTQIRSTDGRHIVVPNSFFLESNVVNWTLSDDLMRTKVSVGVAYGSPTRQVKQLIEEVIRAEPLVLNSPAPNVIFDAFADNSLNFDVYFWVKARSPLRV
ncbi:MAG: mechanosensitive ion channel, partial [Gammaproteobacteria bacterium]|nr:mechanosensitive ion channel [Gammaproteobacteria bacterium]